MPIVCQSNRIVSNMNIYRDNITVPPNSDLNATMSQLRVAYYSPSDEGNGGLIAGQLVSCFPWSSF